MSDERTAGQVRRRHLADEASRSLFVLPALIVLASTVLGEVLAEVDDAERVRAAARRAGWEA